MTGRTRVPVSEGGRVVLPAEVLEALAIRANDQIEIEVVDGAAIVRRAPETDDDAWAYTPRHLELVRRALAEAAAGKSRQLTEADLRALAPTE